MKKFAVFDIDGTLIRWQLYHAVSDALVQLGHFDKEAFKPVKEARRAWKQRMHEESYKTYEDQLVTAFQDLIHRLTPEQFEEASELVFDEYRNQVYVYTRDLIRNLKEQGYVLLAISGSPNQILDKIAKYYEFDGYFGSKFEVKDGRFTGKSKTPFGRKDEVLKELVKEHSLSFKNSVAVGDSESDIAMLKMVDRPIAFNPTKKLLEAAQQNNWKVVLERKNVIYELEPKDGTYILA